MTGLWFAAATLILYLILATALYRRAKKQASCKHSYYFNGFARWDSNMDFCGSYSFLTLTWTCMHCNKVEEGETAYAPDVPEDEEDRLFELPTMTEEEVKKFDWPYEYRKVNG